MLACKKEGCETINQKIIIRNETHNDVCAITEVTIAAFKTLEISHHTEHFIITALRAAKALTVSLVAELDGRVVGHVAFSPRDHLGRHPELVRSWTCVGFAGVPSAGHWQSPNTGRAVTP